ncbi:MAG: FecR domain-containing protein [Bacteroidetes bacterium]|nr:FecR domain-containing protein [Bacteroidota bacterium]
MAENNNRLQYLLNQYANSKSSYAEETELFMLLNNTNNDKAESVLMEILEQTAPMPDENRRKKLLEKVFGHSLSAANKSGAKLRKMKPFPWRRITAAASVILMIGAASYFLFFNRTAKKVDIAKNAVAPQDVKAPAANRAMIALANGQKVYLDSTANGKLIQQKGVEIVKLADGKIAYNGTATELVYNTLTNPRGSRAIDMTLADGSRVWLNAGSSLTYPIAFVGNQRKVSITGEAYFEVAHNAAKPFIVNKNDINTEVLGTHFDVNAYDDEADTKITLLEGSVKVYNDKNSIFIKPGQQAVINKNAGLSVNKNVDTEEVMAWKNGKFIFNSASIESIMRQVSKWYDVEVVYNGRASKETFSGVVSRNSNISDVIRIIEEGGVKCKIEGKDLIVTE